MATKTQMASVATSFSPRVIGSGDPGAAGGDRALATVGDLI